jgi:hypothetical protein
MCGREGGERSLHAFGLSTASSYAVPVPVLLIVGSTVLSNESLCAGASSAFSFPFVVAAAAAVGAGVFDDEAAFFFLMSIVTFRTVESARDRPIHAMIRFPQA